MELQLVVASFVAGILTILAPCTVAVLPIIVGDTATSKRRFKALTITASLMISVVLFTLLLRASTTLLGVPEWIWPTIAGVILVVFGFLSIFPDLWEWFTVKIGLFNKSNQALAKSAKIDSVWGDALVGGALGPVFTSCSPTYGLIVGIVLGGDVLTGTGYLILYTLGLGIMLMAIAFAGQRLVKKLGWATNPKGWFRRVIGVLFMAVGIAIITGWDKSIEAWLLDGGFYDWIINIEGRLMN